MYVCNRTKDPQGIIDFGSTVALQKYFFPRSLILRGMSFEFECLGEFEFIFENNIGEE
jgi:hypothetical protein